MSFSEQLKITQAEWPSQISACCPAVPVAEEDSGVTIPKIFQKDVAVETAVQWKHCLTTVETIYLVHSRLS